MTPNVKKTNIRKIKFFDNSVFRVKGNSDDIKKLLDSHNTKALEFFQNFTKISFLGLPDNLRPT